MTENIQIDKINIYETLKSQFLRPDKIFSPLPFWFWNDDIQEAELTRQIEDFNEKGVNGFAIHPRIGIPTDLQYMSERFLNLVSHAVKEAARLDMQVVLYDEAMYPSGSAHGKVAAINPMFKSRGIRRVTDKSELTEDDRIIFDHEGIYYAEGFTCGTIRGIHFGEDDGEEFAPPSTDLLNKDAVECFISLTHDKYYDAVGEYFGNTIIGMFTDEPSIMGRRPKRGFLPWSADFLEYYKKFGGKIEDIPKLWDDGIETALYRKAVEARLEEVYYKPISEWCEKHNIALMGHPERSDDIALLKYFHIPGQDVVLRWVAPEDNKSLATAHSTQAKCSSDSARHAGKKRNSNECFGACNKDNIAWNFTGADMKWYIDWLCVRGVNMLIPHAFYYSITDKRKYERPPDVGPNNIWWDDYKIISNYIKRQCWLMTDSVNTASVAVLCNTNNLDWEQTAKLYQNQVEFNYLEDFYIEANNIANEHIYVGDNKYNMLFVPPNVSISAEKITLLENNRVKIVYSADEILKEAKREIQCTKYQSELRFSHVVKDGMNFYLFANEGETKIETDIVINKLGHCELWNPWNKKISSAPVIAITANNLTIRLSLERRESIILFLDESRQPKITANTIAATDTQIKHGDGFTVLLQGEKIILDLGDNHEYIRLSVNGKYAGTKMWAPFTFDITDIVKSEGDNTVRVVEKYCKAYEYGGLAPKPNMNMNDEWEFSF